MEKTNRVLRDERSDVQIADIISQFVAMNKEDIQKVLQHRKKEVCDFTPFLYEVLCDISIFHDIKMDREREELFYTVEKEVLASLPEVVRKKVVGRYTALIKDLSHKEDRDKIQKPYREFIIMVYNKEIIFTPRETIFTGANIAIQAKELKFPSKTGCHTKAYKGLDGKIITRHEVDAKAFEKNDEHHKRFMETLESVTDKGLRILTEADIKNITNTYSGWNYDTIDTFLYGSSGPGRFILAVQPHTVYHGFGDYEYGDEEVDILHLKENGQYYKMEQAIDKYGKPNNCIGSFLLARNI